MIKLDGYDYKELLDTWCKYSMGSNDYKNGKFILSDVYDDYEYDSFDDMILSVMYDITQWFIMDHEF